MNERTTPCDWTDERNPEVCGTCDAVWIIGNAPPRCPHGAILDPDRDLPSPIEETTDDHRG